MNMKQPDWHIELIKKVQKGIHAFQVNGSTIHYDFPVCFLYMSDGSEHDWYDWDADIFGIPVYNVTSTCHVLVAQDEECNILPIWKGEMTPQREKMLREFQLRFSDSGDY